MFVSPGAMFAACKFNGIITVYFLFAEWVHWTWVMKQGPVPLLFMRGFHKLFPRDFPSSSWCCINHDTPFSHFWCPHSTVCCSVSLSISFTCCDCIVMSFWWYNDITWCHYYCSQRKKNKENQRSSWTKKSHVCSFAFFFSYSFLWQSISCILMTRSVRVSHVSARHCISCSREWINQFSFFPALFPVSVSSLTRFGSLR